MQRAAQSEKSNEQQSTTAPGPRRSVARSFAPRSSRLGQLAENINNSPRVQGLAQLRSEIDQSSRVQGLMGLPAETGPCATAQLVDAGPESNPAQQAGPALSALLDELESAATLAGQLAAQAGAKPPSGDMIERLKKLRAIAEGNNEPAKAEVLAALRTELDESGAEPASGPPVQRLAVEAIAALAALGVVGLIGLGYLAKKAYEYIRDRREDALLEQFYRDPASVPLMGAAPAEVTAGIAGLPTNAAKAARLFQNINNFRFRYAGLFVNPRLAFQAHQGDCQTLVGMYQEAALALGIPFVLGHQVGPMLVGPQPIHGRDTLTNTEDGTAWYFTEHFWAIGAGTAYDVLFMVTPPPAFVLPAGPAVVRNGVTYHTFADGRAAIERGEDRLNYEIRGQALVFNNAADAIAFIDGHP